MRTYECPSCGAAVNFASAATVFAVCDHCRSMVVRSDVKLESIGTMAELPADLSPLQIGARGEWQGKTFTLIGRVRLAWDEGSWTEWYSFFNDGTRAWIAETQGFFTVSARNETDAIPHRIQTLQPGSTVDFAHRRWRVVEGKTVTCLAGEGELPFVAKPGSARYSVDLVGPSGEFGTLEDAEGELSFYEGNYARFIELKFANLRPVPGWSDTSPQPNLKQSRALSCPNCGAPVGLRAPGLTMSVVCGSCQTVLDASQPQVQVVQRAQEKQQDLAPVLRLGIRGTFYGNVFEVIGYVVREDPFSRWSEYLLFNPWHGFAWLVSYRGHWSLVWRLLVPPASIGAKVVRFEGEAYPLFADGDSRVRGVLGEFYWRVSRGEVSKVADFVAPPKIVSCETYPGLNEETWSAGEYKTPKEIAAAFSLPQPLPEPEGPYLNEPNPYKNAWLRVRRWAVIAVVLLCLIEAGSFVVQPPQTVFTGPFHYVAGTAEQTETTTPTFHLAKPSQPLVVKAYAPVSNSWIDLDVELVNATTGETRPLEIEVSYYSGYDSDGSWTEGSHESSGDWAAVPAGDYFVRVSAAADPGLREINYSLSIRSGGVFWSNFFLSLGLVLVYPLWVLWRRVAFEHRRWAESDFIPFAAFTSKKDDD